MRRNWPIFILIAVIAGVVWVSCYTKPSDNGKQNSTDNSAIHSGIAPNQIPQSSDEENRAAPSSPQWRRLFTWPDGVATLGVLLTLIFIAWQALLTRQAIASSDASSKAELRAYLGVTINNASYQERDKEIKFAGNPMLTNTGKTPAHRVRYRNNAAVLKEPLPQDYVFASGQSEIGGYVLGMNSPMVMQIVVDDYCDQQDVEDIMSGTKGRALFYWGKVTYNDAFGESHETEFCHRIWFSPDLQNVGQYKVSGTYLPGRNQAT